MMTARRIFMVRPAHFGFNEETAVSNVFQQEAGIDPQTLQQQALREFDDFVNVLRSAGIETDVLQDDPNEKRPDAVFPNNWMSTHADGTLITYPMHAPLRRLERDENHVRYIIENYHVNTHVRMEYFEAENLYLEGTGSMVLDHEYRIAYACRSVRTDAEAFLRFCRWMDFTPVLFDGRDENGIPLYHTNIMMAIGKGFVVINRSAVHMNDWSVLERFFIQTRKEIIDISHGQTRAFLGNIIYLKNAEGEPCIVMSASAEAALEEGQKEKLNKYGRKVVCDISTIETAGGGSARCMIAENYLRPRNKI